MKKNCIFDPIKICDECGECFKCDINPNKKCNNCGICLELEGYDTKAIKIDELIEEPDEILEFQNEGSDKANETDQIEEEDVQWEYIDDVKDLKEILKDEEKFKILAKEDYPGLIILKDQIKTDK